MRAYPYAFAGLGVTSVAEPNAVTLAYLTNGLRPAVKTSTMTSLVLAQERGVHERAVRRKAMKRAIKRAMIDTLPRGSKVRRMRQEATQVLHDATEEYLVNMFIKANARAQEQNRGCLLGLDVERVVREGKHMREALMDARYFDPFASDMDSDSSASECSTSEGSTSEESEDGGSPTPDNSEAEDSSASSESESDEEEDGDSE